MSTTDLNPFGLKAAAAAGKLPAAPETRTSIVPCSCTNADSASATACGWRTSRLQPLAARPGRVYDAKEGLAIGISQYVVEPGQGLEKAFWLAHRIAVNEARHVIRDFQRAVDAPSGRDGLA